MVNFRLLILLTTIIFLSGCVNQNGNGGSSSGLSVEITDIPQEVVSGTPFDVELTIENTVESNMDNVVIIMSDPSSLSILSVDCDTDGMYVGNGCQFSTIPENEKRVIVFKMDSSAIDSDRAINPLITTSFDFKGTSILQIPIKNRKANVNPSSNFIESEGPIKLDLKKTGDNNNFVYSDGFLVLQMSFKDNSGESNVEFNPLTNPNALVITLDNFYVEDSSKCNNFMFSGIRATNGDVSQTMKLNNKIVASGEDSLSCVLRAATTDLWKYGSITAEYQYRYESYKELDIKLTALP